MYAIIEQNGHQYKIKPGLELDFDHLGLSEGKVFTNNKVLLLVDKNNFHLGKPYLPSVKVELKVIKNYQGKKLRVLRFRAKSRYTKVSGFRPFLSRVRVEAIKVN